MFGDICNVTLEKKNEVMTYDNVPCDAVPCDAMPCDAMPCDAVPCDAVPCDAVPCDAVQCDAMSDSTVNINDINDITKLSVKDLKKLASDKKLGANIMISKMKKPELLELLSK